MDIYIYIYIYIYLGLLCLVPLTLKPQKALHGHLWLLPPFSQPSHIVFKVGFPKQSVFPITYIASPYRGPKTWTHRQTGAMQEQICQQQPAWTRGIPGAMDMYPPAGSLLEVLANKIPNEVDLFVTERVEASPKDI
jgi:hypothetical protein